MSTKSVVGDRAALERFEEEHPKLGSASKIAAINEDAFVQEYAPAFEDNPDQARLVHQTAVNITEKTALIWANIKDAVASPYIKGTRFNNIQIPQSFIDYLEQIPAYHRLFGSLDFIECDHCRSIFGPAAYFADLLRFVDKNITQHPSNDIPPGHKLEERRPGLAHLRLDCRNAYDLVPYVDLVTEIVEAIVQTEAMPDAYQVLEAADFPINLPFNLPLAEIRSYLKQLKTSLSQIYQTFETDPPHKHNSITREFLELSPREFNLITSEISDPTELTKFYGNVPLSGEDGLENVEVFLEQTGLSRQELNELVFQDLDRHEIDAGLSRLFFINNVGDGLGYLTIEQDPNQPLDPTYATERLVNLSNKKLDHIYRFLKLARKLGWSFIDLDWALRSLHEPYIPENVLGFDGINDDPACKLPSIPLDEAALYGLAAIKRLKEQFSLPMDKLCALWHSLKHIGRENRQTLYNQVFNPVGVIIEPWPYYAAQPVVWDTTGQTDRARDERIRNRLMGTLQLSHDDLNRLVAKLSGPEETIITLDGDYLANLYRLARLPGLLRMSVKEFVRLLALLGLDTVRSLEDLMRLVDQAEWMRRTGIDVYELDFLTNDAPSEHASFNYTEADILDLADDLTRQARDFLIKPDAFVSPEIDQYQAKAIFDYLGENGFIDRLGAVTPKYSNPGDLAGLAQKLEWGTDFEALQDQIGDTLLRRQGELANAILAGISGLVGVDPERLQPVLEYFKDEMSPARCLELMMAGQEGPPIPADLNNYLYKLNKILYLTGQFDLSVAETQALIKQPESFGVKQILNPDINDLDNLYLFKELRTAFNDTTGKLIDLLAMPVDDDAAVLEAIVALTDWEERQLRSIMAHFDSEEPYNRPASLNRLKVCFDLADLLRVDIEFLIRLAQTDSLSFDFYQGQAAALLKVLRARYTDEQWPETYQPIHNALAVLKRDALISQAMLQLSAEYEGRKDPDILSEYLLLDVQTGSEVETSRLVQATAAVQLYVQRCLMNLEAGVKPESIPAKEWDWMKNYRVWEANRKVFLYPENYIEPELRDTKTPFFEALEQELMQNDINRQTVETAYTNYLDKFAEIANLKIVGSYLHLDSVGGVEEKILYLIGRTRTQPYSYYYRTCLNEKEWQPWIKIDLAIKADFVTPVYAFGKLFLFWPEFMKTVKTEPIRATLDDERQEKEIVEEDGVKYLALQRVKLQQNIDIYIPTIKYSFYNFSGKWIPPQDFLKLEGVTEDRYIRPEYQRVYAQRTLPSQPEPEKEENVEVSLAVQPIIKRERIIQFYGNQIRSLRNNLEDQGFELTLQRPDSEQANYDLDLSGSTLQLTLTNGLSYNDYADDDETTVSRFAPEHWQTLKERFPNLADGTKIAGPKDDLLHGLTRAETSLVDVNNQPGWYLLDSGDEQFLIKAQTEHRLMPASERLKFEYEDKDGHRETDPQPISIYFDPDEALAVELLDLEPEFALKFNGVNDYIALPPMEPNAYDQGFTVEAWVYYRSFKQWSRIIDFGNGPETNNILLANNDVTNMLTLSVFPRSGNYRIDASEALELNVWLHLAATVDGTGNAVLYKNGQRLVRGQINAPKTEERRNNYIGRSNWLADGYFDGDMREVRIWNVARSQDDIKANMNQPLKGDEPGLVGYWRFDKPYVEVEAGGVRVPDQSRAGNHGQLKRIEFDPWIYHMKYKPLKFAFERLSTFAVHDLSQNLFTGGLDQLLSLESQQLEEVNFEAKYRYNRELITPPNYDPSSDQIDYRLDFDGAYGLYYREIFFHIPFLIANQLNTNQRFAEAQKWYHYLFNPTAQEPAGTSGDNSSDRYWRFRPFRNVSLESLRQILFNEEALAAYRRDPFDPHAIARLRLNAYQKAVVMKYIDNLLDWGDYLFSRDTREAINEAVMLYILAYDLLGPRPKAKTVKQFAEIGSYADLKQAHGAEIPEFLVELAQQMGDSAAGAGAPNPHNNLITTFGVLENEQFIGYWDRVEDRLFKIRHSLTIEGVFRPLALFEPPISPMALVRAVAGGRDLGSVLSDLTVPVPHYRYAVMVDKAKEMVTTVIDLGQKLLAALASKDAEQLAVLQNVHEKSILNLMTAIKESELAIAGETIEALRISKASIEARKTHLDTLVADGRNTREEQELNLYWSAVAFYGAAGVAKLTGGIIKVIPDTTTGTVGVGGSPEFTIKFGGRNWAALAEGLGELAAATAEALDDAAIATGRLAEYERRQAEWQHEQTMAEKDLEEIDKQIAIAEMQRSIAGQQLALHHKTIQQNLEIADFYRRKFSNEALYTWLVGRLAGLYFQAYKLAYDLAKSAEKALQYELPTTESYISFGHWDSLKKGLLAGESLLLELNRMDKARLAQDSRFQNIEKTISLQKMMPGTLALLQAKGKAEFQLSERLFDRDFPGHYCRLIKSVALSIKTDDGPLPEVHATLTQLGSKVLLEPDSGAVQYLLGVEGAEQPAPGVIRANWRANQQIAISRAVEDAGMFGQFDLNLLFDDRYFPFEGTGTVSSWRLEIPPANNDFELTRISDVVIQLKYTAKVAGGPFKQAVTDMQANFESGAGDDDTPPAGPSNGTEQDRPSTDQPKTEQPAPDRPKHNQPEKKHPKKEQPSKNRSRSG